MNAPKLRPDIEVIPTQYEGKQVVVIKDPLGLIAQPVLLYGEDLEFAQLLDGKRTVQDIQLYLMRRKGGLLVSSDAIQQTLDRFDALYLLDSKHYLQAKNKIIDHFSGQSIRRAYLAGSAYPESESALRNYLDMILSLASQEEASSIEESPKALVTPHIDLGAGKTIYGLAYRAVRHLSPKKIFLFGTGHGLQDDFVSLTNKDFETPLGLVKTDAETVRKLKSAAGSAAAPSDFAHRSEHSIEFQALFLRHLFGDTFVCVPILFGSFREVLNAYSRPREIPGMGAFLGALKHAVEADSSDTLCVAGVDFSHIGPKFGHRRTSAAIIQEARVHDGRLIDKICSGDVEGLWAETKKVEGYYNVCGFSALACLLEILPGSKGRLLGYDFWTEESTQSAVSFAGIAIGD